MRGQYEPRDGVGDSFIEVERLDMFQWKERLSHDGCEQNGEIMAYGYGWKVRYCNWHNNQFQKRKETAIPNNRVYISYQKSVVVCFRVNYV